MSVISKTGYTLQTKLDECLFLDEDSILRLIIQVVLALQQIHSQSQLHLNISPTSIFINDEQGKLQVKLYDFGHKGHSRESVRFQSIAQQEGKLPAKRDDLESLCYLVRNLFFNNLPWDGAAFQATLNQKKEWFNEQAIRICDGLPLNFQNFINAVSATPRDSEPQYFDLITILLNKKSLFNFKWNSHLTYHDLHKAAFLI